MTSRRLLIATFVAAGCGGSDASSPGRIFVPSQESGVAASVTIVPPKGRTSVGATLRLTAVARDAAGRVVLPASLDWSSDMPDAATVGSDGTVHGHLPGYVRITAAAGSARDYAMIQVDRNGAYPDVVRLSPDAVSVSACGALQFTAVTLPDVARPLFRWRSSDPAVLTVSADGLARGVAPGSAMLSVAWAPDTSRAASRAVQVTPC